MFSKYSFKTDYAKSGRSSCRFCRSKINKNELRLAEMILASTFDGHQANWYHNHCFFKIHKPDSVNLISDFLKLKHEDQVMIKSRIGEKRKSPAPSEETENFLIEYSDCDKKCCYCNTEISKGAIKISKTGSGGSLLYHVKCFVQNRHQLEFFSGGENLPGYNALKEDDKLNIKDAIQSVAVDGFGIKKSKIDMTNLAQDIRTQNELFQNYKHALKQLKREDIKDILWKNHQYNYYTLNVCLDLLADCLMFGALRRCNQCRGQLLFDSCGYHCNGSKKYSTCSFVTQTPGRYPMFIPKEYQSIPLLAEYKPKVGTRIFEANPLSDTATTSGAILKNNDAYGNDADISPQSSNEMDCKTTAYSEIPQSKKSKSIKLNIRDGSAVDPQSGLMDAARVYSDDVGTKYTAVLSKTDCVSMKNSYYKMQVLQSNCGKKYWLFKSWGRIGTLIGDTSLKCYDDVSQPIIMFKTQFLRLTRNVWEKRRIFEKIRYGYQMLDVSYSDDEDEEGDELAVHSQYELAKPVQELIVKIFNIRLMKKAMLEYELDPEAMPLGKLSNAQIASGYLALNDILQLVEAESVDLEQLREANSKFYTLIPHNLGVKNAPLLNTLQHITEKTNMLDHLTDIEAAYKLIQRGKGGPWDVPRAYRSLQCHIEPLPPDCPEYNLITDYVTNTHANTHTHFSIEIEHVFNIRRQGEEERFAPFKKLHNRRLLWHGSGITNFAGILSQGLRIAPGEASTRGHMFGKGIYFADMVSKSANYSYGDPREGGLLLLCEVALGNMKSCFHGLRVKLEEGEHSVWGVGRTQPDPSMDNLLPDGTIIPLGNPVSHDIVSSLLYNEFVVYDPAQVNLKYLVQVKFLT